MGAHITYHLTHTSELQGNAHAKVTFVVKPNRVTSWIEIDINDDALVFFIDHERLEEAKLVAKAFNNLFEKGKG